VFVGFAHGAAGMACALLRLFEATGIDAFRDAAERGYRFERGLFLRASGNWPLVGPLDGPSGGVGSRMNAWCHGAPGIALANAFALDIFPEAAMLSEVEAALRTTATWTPHQPDHLCCGNLGRCDVLMTVGRRRDVPAATAAAVGLAHRVTERARERGHFTLCAPGFEYRVFDPGFFRGLSGIGYQLLRLAAPSELPSILSFEAPVPVGS
jgi:lantibiotic modifying enzyme